MSTSGDGKEIQKYLTDVEELWLSSPMW